MNADFFEMAPGDAAALSSLLCGARPEYVEHFHPFPFTEEAIAQRLRDRRLDPYWGIRCEGGLAGFCMLRGLDEGFARPAFGVFVAEAFRGRGLAGRALDFSIQWCGAQGLASLILTVHPDNCQARRLYVARGFAPIGTNPKTGHEILEKALP